MSQQTKQTKISLYKVEYFNDSYWIHLGGRWFDTYDDANNYLKESLTYIKENPYIGVEKLRVVFKSEVVELTYYDEVFV